MKLKLQPHSFKKGILILIVDEEEWKEVAVTIFGKRLSFPKNIQTISELEEFLLAKEVKGAKRYILNRLAKCSYCSFELKKKLSEKLVSDAVADKVVEECVQYGYINDREWIERFIEREQRKGKGASWIKNRLWQKGIPNSLSEEIIASCSSEEEEKKQIVKLLQTRYRSRNLEDYKEREKTVAALIRRGYPLETIREALLMKSLNG